MNTTHQPSFPSSYTVDRRLERKESDVRVHLNGLNEARMSEAWEAFKRDPVKYNMLRYNCSTLVASILEIGSGVPPSFRPTINVDDHVQDRAMRLINLATKKPQPHDMWTPDAVWRYAGEIAHRQHP